MNLKDHFSRASKSFLDANPHLCGNLKSVQPVPDPPKATRRGNMNATEREFSFILEAQKRNGDILRWEFEPITLRFSGVSYTPDFCVWPTGIAVSGQIKFVEVKGAFAKGKFERAVERFRHARTFYGDVFLFELWQRADGRWSQIL